MDLPRQRIAPLVIIILVALMLLVCGAGIYASRRGISPAAGMLTPTPGNGGSPDAASAYAQATIDAGQSQLSDLSVKATQVSLNVAQAADAAAQATQDYNQQQQLLLDQQATVISLNIAHAAATQKVIRQQTKMARDAAASATQSANQVNLGVIAQAKALVNAQVSQTAQAVAAATGYPLTATPFAATQAALLMQEYDREQKSFVTRVVSPLIPIVAAILILLLFILVISLVYRRLIPSFWPRRLRIAQVNTNPLVMIDGVMVDHALPLHQIIPPVIPPTIPFGLPCEKPVTVEIVDSAEAPVAHWIAEVQDQLANEGGQPL